MFLRLRSGRRILAEEPACQPLRVLQADAAMAEVALVLGEEFFLGSIVKIDTVAVRKVELEVAEGIGRTGTLANIDLRLTGSDGFPVDVVRGKHARIWPPAGENFITPVGEVGVAVLKHARSNERL